MESRVKNIRTKNYQDLVIGFQVTVTNVGDVFLRHSVVTAMFDTNKSAHKQHIHCVIKTAVIMTLTFSYSKTEFCRIHCKMHDNIIK